jgi:hypothetical protein
MSTFSNENHVTRGFTSDAINEFAFRLHQSLVLISQGINHQSLVLISQGINHQSLVLISQGINHQSLVLISQGINHQ